MPEPESQKRARRDESFYRELLAEPPTSGLTLKPLALSKGIKPATLYAWSRRLHAESGSPGPERGRNAPDDVSEELALRPVRVVSAAGVGTSRSQLVEIIVRGDVEIRVPADLGAEPLARLVSALRG